MDTTDRLIRAVQLAARKLASSGNFNLLLKDVLIICVEAVGASAGTIYLHDASAKRLQFQHVLPEGMADRLPVRDIADDFGTAGLAFQTNQTQTKVYPKKPESDWNQFEKATGVAIETMVATPLAVENMAPIGVVQLINKREGEFNQNDVAVLDTISAVATMAYLNYRLTEESARASSLLGMGKVSHDIGNLAASLYASLSYSSMEFDGLAVHLNSLGADTITQDHLEALNPMFDELKMSVGRIVGYSRIISDMSAGRTLRPNLRLGSIAQTVYLSTSYFATQARANRVELKTDIQPNSPESVFDELYIFRIVQNLVGNAIKAVRETAPDELFTEEPSDDDDFTPQGTVTVRYRFTGKMHILEVTDTGPGMTQATANKILIGDARSQWDKGSGSGWGTKIVLELAAAHNATVGIESELGQGATFRVEIPHRVGV